MTFRQGSHFLRCSGVQLGDSHTPQPPLARHRSLSAPRSFSAKDGACSSTPSVPHRAFADSTQFHPAKFRALSVPGTSCRDAENLSLQACKALPRTSSYSDVGNGRSRSCTPVQDSSVLRSSREFAYKSLCEDASTFHSRRASPHPRVHDGSVGLQARKALTLTSAHGDSKTSDSNLRHEEHYICSKLVHSLESPTSCALDASRISTCVSVREDHPASSGPGRPRTISDLLWDAIAAKLKPIEPHPLLPESKACEVLVRDFEHQFLHFNPLWQSDEQRCGQCADHIWRMLCELAAGERRLVPVSMEVYLPVPLMSLQIEKRLFNAGTKMLLSPHSCPEKWPSVFESHRVQLQNILFAWSNDIGCLRDDVRQNFDASIGIGGHVLRWNLGEIRQFGRYVFEQKGLPVPCCPEEIWYQLFRESQGSALTMLNFDGAIHFAMHLIERALSFHLVSPPSVTVDSITPCSSPTLSETACATPRTSKCIFDFPIDGPSPQKVPLPGMCHRHPLCEIGKDSASANCNGGTCSCPSCLLGCRCVRLCRCPHRSPISTVASTTGWPKASFRESWSQSANNMHGSDKARADSPPRAANHTRAVVPQLRDPLPCSVPQLSMPQLKTVVASTHGESEKTASRYCVNGQHLSSHHGSRDSDIKVELKTCNSEHVHVIPSDRVHQGVWQRAACISNATAGEAQEAAEHAKLEKRLTPSKADGPDKTSDALPHCLESSRQEVSCSETVASHKTEWFSLMTPEPSPSFDCACEWAKSASTQLSSVQGGRGVVSKLNMVSELGTPFPEKQRYSDFTPEKIHKPIQSIARNFDDETFSPSANQSRDDGAQTFSRVLPHLRQLETCTEEDFPKGDASVIGMTR